MSSSSKLIVHICFFDKFIKDFVEFNEENCSSFEHHYFILGYHDKYSLPDVSRLDIFPSDFKGKLRLSLKLSRLIKSASKVFIHGLFTRELIIFLFLHRCYLHKAYWVMWGADLYMKDMKTLKKRAILYLRKIVCSSFGGVVTYIKGDYKYAKERWGVKGGYYECIMYPSNIFTDPDNFDLPTSDEFNFNGYNVLVGNSSDPSNNHREAFDKLSLSLFDNYNVYSPLSYGSEINRDKVIKYGNEKFGSRFYPLTNFLQIADYKSLLSSIDIAMFNHKRQQAMGNTINLIGLGKTVYLRSDVTQWSFLKELGLHVFDIESFDGSVLTTEEKKINNFIVKNYFSKENYNNQLNKIYLS